MDSKLLYSLLSVFLYASNVFSKKINYIKEPAQMRINPVNRPLLVDDAHLSPRVRPSDITVPPHLSILRGQCFTKIISDYRYQLCPFQNATQYEQSFKWNPYSGIIGIWKEWLIDGNKFKEMTMPDGDDCGDKKRQTRVIFTCSREDTSRDAHIVSVEEPSTCEYLITASTHLTCFNHSLNVYPFLPQAFQEHWDELEWRYEAGEVTEKGYKTFLRELLIEAKFLLSESEEASRWNASRAQKTSDAVEAGRVRSADVSRPFSTLIECSEEYFRLSEYSESLKKELDSLKNVKNQTLAEEPLLPLT